MVNLPKLRQESFTKTMQFAIDPLYIMWSKKKLLLSLLSVPLLFVWILHLLLPIFFSKYDTQESWTQLIIQITLVFLQPFWAIIWIRSLYYPNEKVNIRSYFSLTKTYSYFLAYLIFLQLLNIPIDYLEDVKAFNNFTFFVIWLFWTIIRLPLLLQFPALAIQKPFPVWKAWKLARPFYVQYLFSFLLISLLFAFAFSVFIYISGYISTALYISALHIFQFLHQWWPHTLISAAIMLLIITYLLTLPSLYYKEYLAKK